MAPKIVQFSTPKSKTNNIKVIAKQDLGIYLMRNKWTRDSNTRPPYLPPEKSVCRSRSNS